MDALGREVITYQMPKGVEHSETPPPYGIDAAVITYQMPKGVEHVDKAHKQGPGEGRDYIPDAERR